MLQGIAGFLLPNEIQQDVLTSMFIGGIKRGTFIFTEGDTPKCLRTPPVKLPTVALKPSWTSLLSWLTGMAFTCTLSQGSRIGQNTGGLNTVLLAKKRCWHWGNNPDVTLDQARQRREEARKQLANGIDPGEHKKAVKSSKAELAANSFEVIAREWMAKKTQDKSPRPMRLLNYVMPWIGRKPVTDILPRDILACLRRVEERGTIETAHRTLQITGQVFRYAVATSRAERDITQDLKGALPPAKGEHFAAITEPKQAAELLRAIDGY